jgi:hypothetical protein
MLEKLASWNFVIIINFNPLKKLFQHKTRIIRTFFMLVELKVKKKSVNFELISTVKMLFYSEILNIIIDSFINIKTINEIN